MIRRVYAVFALLGAMLARPAGAEAQLVARVEVSSTCPGASSLRAALASTIDFARVAGADTWLVRVGSTRAGTATLSLLDPSGRVSLERTIESLDCDAIADAFALITYTHFIELSVLPASTPPPTPHEPGSPAAPEPSATPAPSPPAVPTTPPVDGSGAGPPPPLQPRGPRMSWARLAFAVSAGGSLGVSPSLLSAFGAAALGLAPTALPLGVELRGSAWTATTQQATAVDRVRLRRYAIALALTRRIRLGTRGRLDLALGGGADFTLATALDIVGTATVVRVHPTIELGVLLGLGLVGPLWAAIEVHGTALPLGDRYRIEPVGTVGLTSLLVLDAGLVLGVDANL